MERIILVWVTFLLFACDFTLDGEVITQVPDRDLSDVTIKINCPYDTIRTFQNRDINYSVIGNEVDSAATLVILGGDTIQINPFSSGTFTIDVNTLGSGNYPLPIYSVFTTQTKSLAGSVDTGNRVLF